MLCSMGYRSGNAKYKMKHPLISEPPITAQIINPNGRLFFPADDGSPLPEIEGALSQREALKRLRPAKKTDRLQTATGCRRKKQKPKPIAPSVSDPALWAMTPTECAARLSAAYRTPAPARLPDPRKREAAYATFRSPPHWRRIALTLAYNNASPLPHDATGLFVVLQRHVDAVATAIKKRLKGIGIKEKVWLKGTVESPATNPHLHLTVALPPGVGEHALNLVAQVVGRLYGGGDAECLARGATWKVRGIYAEKGWIDYMIKETADLRLQDRMILAN